MYLELANGHIHDTFVIPSIDVSLEIPVLKASTTIFTVAQSALDRRAPDA